MPRCRPVKLSSRRRRSNHAYAEPNLCDIQTQQRRLAGALAAACTSPSLAVLPSASCRVVTVARLMMSRQPHHLFSSSRVQVTLLTPPSGMSVMPRYMPSRVTLGWSACGPLVAEHSSSSSSLCPCQVSVVGHIRLDGFLTESARCCCSNTPSGSSDSGRHQSKLCWAADASRLSAGQAG